jgi:hypothetical protein
MLIMDIDVDINGCCNCQIQFVEPLLDEVMLKIVEMFSGTSGVGSKGTFGTTAIRWVLHKQRS